jgi:hypothetical protein
MALPYPASSTFFAPPTSNEQVSNPMEPIRLGLGDEIPGWGYLPAEQYLIVTESTRAPYKPA